MKNLITPFRNEKDLCINRMERKRVRHNYNGEHKPKRGYESQTAYPQKARSYKSVW